MLTGLEWELGELERIVKFYPAYDKRDSDPGKDYGIHCVDLLMLVRGPEGAVQFKLFTGWYLPQNHFSDMRPMPADLGYHSKTPRYEGHEPLRGRSKDISPDYDPNNIESMAAAMPKYEGELIECEWIGAPCYYDGSGLNAERIFKVMLEEGSDGVWRELEEYYRETFQ